jgi:HAD superfamily hydrolase (TIGR01456 family)
MFSLSRLSFRFRSTFAVAFDLDGVMYRGKELIPSSTTALQTLDRQGVPWLLLTNGGGVLEEEKAKSLTTKLNHPIPVNRLQQSHTPLRELVGQYQDKLVVVFGSNNAKSIALEYGFRRVVSTIDIHAAHPSIYPDKKPTTSPPSDVDSLLSQPVGALMGFMDPFDYHRDLQICSDILHYNGIINPPGPTPSQQIPLYMCGPDFLYVSEWASPRFGAGVFQSILSHVHKACHGKELKFHIYGKPHSVTYAHAQAMIMKQAPQMGIEDIHTIYMVGDNPETDIKGANDFGGKWKSVLVRTGVHNKPGNDPTNPATHVADHVGAAVEWILQQEAK